MMLSGCDSAVRSPAARRFFRSAEGLSQAMQRTLLSGQRLAREFKPSESSPTFRSNGSSDPQTPDYVALREANFSTYRLIVEGLVGSPQSLSLTQLMLIPSRSQITRHDCVEGWSAIGKWSGAPLHSVLERAGILNTARLSSSSASISSRSPAARRPIMRASTSSTPSTRKPFSPMR